ncbi:TetR/AcrR family transcriptional regulator [Ureibacillus sp. MALMAid1270]|uniref:TetR/AcrR family transcriptional regulator n=1 Tax=Ureibacillus sp. MALMAid1270 TaxID=3411629 RepID=UPI003BA79A0A
MARGRKVNSNGERSMKLLREKAIELFSEYGYFQTKISDIVKAAKVTQPTFYLYFESKESLYKDIIIDFQTNLEKIFDESKNAQETDQNTTQLVQEILIRLFTFFAENPHLTKIGLYETNTPFVYDILLLKFKNFYEKHLYTFQTDEVSSQIFIQSLIGSVERLTKNALLSENIQPEKLASEISAIYFAKELTVAQ